MNRLTIYPDEELLNKLNSEAKEKKRSMNNLILLILASYFDEEYETAD